MRTAVKVNGVPYDRPANPFHADNDSLILGTDAIPSPGFSRVRTYVPPSPWARLFNDLTRMLWQFGTRTPKGDITITNRVQGVTVGAAPFFQGTAILHVLSNAIRVLDPGTSRHFPRSTERANAGFVIDGTERQIIKDMEGNNQRPRIKYSSICDPFVFILREDETIGLFIGEPERGKIRRKDMSPMGEKVGLGLFSFYTDINYCAKRLRAILPARSLRIRRVYSQLEPMIMRLLQMEMDNLLRQRSNLL